MMKNPHPSRRRVYVLLGFFCAFLVLFFAVLYDAQVVHGSENRARSITSNTASETVTASRGIITDRNGKVLVSNRLAYTLVVDKSSFGKDEAALNDAIWQLMQLCQEQGVTWNDTLPMTTGSSPQLTSKSLTESFREYLDDNKLPTDGGSAEVLAAMRKLYKVDDSYTDAQARLIVGVRYELDGRSSYTFAEDVSTELLGRITDGKYRGVTIKTAAARVYNTKLAAHILGTVGAIWQEEWRSDESTGYVGYADKGYNMNDLVGKDGVEKAFEEYLHGKDGKRLITTDENGKITGELYSVEPKPGSTVALTIDIDFQAQVEEALKNTVSSMTKSDGIDRGAAVAVVQVGTGDVLALASYPTYSLSTFRQDLAELSTDPLQPMWNRATQGKYAPGSTLKPLTAIAALESGATTVREKIYDSGKWTYPGYSASYTYCWKRSGHGSLNVRGAIMNSCNYFFAEMGYRMGMDTLREYYAKFGLGSPTGIEIGDTAGRLPSQNEGENLAPWAAFGQANQEYSPLQLANYIATLCGGGDRYATHLLKNVRSSGSGALEYVYDAEPAETIAMSSENLSAVLAGMHDLATDGAVSQYFKNCIVDAAAKTGTIQTGDTKNNNGAFVCFAPYDDPQIAVAIVIEKGGSGAALASTAVQVLNAYFSNTSASSAITGENTLLG